MHIWKLVVDNNVEQSVKQKCEASELKVTVGLPKLGIVFVPRTDVIVIVVAFSPNLLILQLTYSRMSSV